MCAASVDPLRVVGAILAGGAGMRVNGADKGLLSLQGEPLIEHVLAALRPQCDKVLIVANRNRDAYARHAATIADEIAGFAGPLAGIAAALQQAGPAASSPRRKIVNPDSDPGPQSIFLLTVPVDCPQPPRDLAKRLRNALQTAPQLPCAFAHDGRGPQPLFALYRMTAGLLNSAHAALQSHASPVRWHQEIGASAVDFSDCAATFDNLNTPDDFRACEQGHDAR